MKLKEEELTGLIRQTAYEVHRYFGNGFLEKVYENSLSNRLRKQGLTVAQQVPVNVYDEDGTIVGDYFVDLLVNEFLVVELKVHKKLNDEHYAQLIHYLISNST